jgi:MFS family permease
MEQRAEALSSREKITPLYAWTVVLLMTLISASSYIDRTVLGMLVQPIRADLRITDTEFSYLTGLAFALMYTSFGIPLGWLSDRFSRRAIISIGCAAWSIMTAACGLASTYVNLFLCRIGVGIGEASLQPCAYPLIGGYFPTGTARAMSVYNMGQPIGNGLAMIIGGFLIGALTAAGAVHLPIIGATRPWQVVFLVVGLPGIALALLAALIVRDPPRRAEGMTQPSFAKTCAFMWRERKVYATLILSLGSVSVLAYGGPAWFPSYLMRVEGFSPSQAGLLIGLSSTIGGIIGSFFIGSITDRLMAKGRRDIATRVLIPVAIGAFVCAAIGPIVPIRWLSLSLFACSGFFMLTATGVYHVLRQAVTPREIWGQVTAIYIFFTNLMGLTIGPTAIALCTDYVFHSDKAVNYSIAIVAGAAMSVVVLSLWIGRKSLERRIGAPAEI